MILHTRTNRVYIGSSKDIARRWQYHRYQLKKGCHHSPYLQHLVTSDGLESLQFSVIEELPETSLCRREQFWLDLIQPELNGSKEAVRLAHGRVVNEETRRKIGQALTRTSCRLGHAPEDYVLYSGRHNCKVCGREKTRRLNRLHNKIKYDNNSEGLRLAKQEAGKLGAATRWGRGTT